MIDEENHEKAIEPAADNSGSTLSDAKAFSRTIDSSEPEETECVEHRVLNAGDKLGKYEIIRKLGQGGMGAVYLAFDPMIERKVAIKVLPPQVASNPKSIERFLSEARATGKLNHPNVVAIYDIATDDESYYIVMELVSGGSGSDFIANRDALDWHQACTVAIDACKGLAAAHAAGLVHRDIKPENLMLTDEGVVKVVDFGLSKLVDAANESQLGLTGAGQIVGTPHYMSPEQFEGRNVDARSDVYSMGGTLFTLLTSKPPFADATNIVNLMTSHLRTPPPDPAEVNAEIPTACRLIVQKAMAKDPDQRYRDAGELATAIGEVLSATHKSVGATSTQTYRPLDSAIIVEPSRMQAMMLKNALTHRGASKVDVFGSAADALSACENNPPDLLVTAMRLTDAKGVELMQRLRDDGNQRDTVLVLNSSDSSIDQVVDVRHAEPLAVVSKTTKPDELLRNIHCSTFLNVGELSTSQGIDATTMRFCFVCDGSRIPDPVVALIRQSNLLDVEVTNFDELAAGKDLSGPIDLVFALRNAGDSSDDHWLYAELVTRLRIEANASVAVQVDGERLTLRAVQRGGFTAVSRGPLDADRMARLVQLRSNS